MLSLSLPSRTDIRRRVERELRATCRDLPDPIPGGALFMSELGLDSLDLVEFVARMEQAFRLPVPDDDWPRLASLDDVVGYVAARLEAAA